MFFWFVLSLSEVLTVISYIDVSICSLSDIFYVSYSLTDLFTLLRETQNSTQEQTTKQQKDIRGPKLS